MERLSEEDVDRIADAVAYKAHIAFQIEAEHHYNQHQRLDRLLDAYDGAANIFTKTFFSLVIVGMIILAGLTAAKGWK